jgi:hypothetical protein
MEIDLRSDGNVDRIRHVPPVPPRRRRRSR